MHNQQGSQERTHRTATTRENSRLHPMTKIVRLLLIGFLIVTHFAEFGSVVLFVLHVQFGSSTPVDHLATIVLTCGTAIFLDCWLLLVLFDTVSVNRRSDFITWSTLILASALFPVL